MKQSKNLTVVYIITKLEFGGAQKVCLNLFYGIQNAGLNATLISGSEGTLVDSVKQKKHVILLDSFKRRVSISSIINECKTFFHLIYQLRKLKKTHSRVIVHTHSTKAGLLGRWAAFFAGIKVRVHTIHGYCFHDHQPKLAWFTIYALEWITNIITTHYVCVSSADVKTGIRLFPKFKEKHSIIRAAVDWQQFYTPARSALPFPTDQELFIFGTVSCFKPQKNLFDLLRAFEHAHKIKENIRLEIVGDGMLRTKIETWIRAHNLNSVIKLHGWQQNVAPIMQQWHAFVLSSLWEGLPCSVVEARLSKLPIVSYNTGGIRDIIFDHENGLLVEQKNWHGLAHRMFTLASDQTLYTQLQNHTQDLNDFKSTHMVKQHIELYTQMFNSN